MKIVRISAKVDSRFIIVPYEGIQPTVKLYADLEEGDDASACVAELFKLAEKEWAKESLRMIRFNRTRFEDPSKFDADNELLTASFKKLASGT